MTDSVHLITLQWSELASQITRPCQVVARLFSRPACRLWPELFHCFLSAVNLRSYLCVRLEFSFLGRRDPGFATSIWNSSSIKLLVGIVDKWLSISASTVVMNRLHGVLTLQEGLSSLCPQWAPFFTVLKHLSAAFSPHSLGMGEDVCVCVFPCPKRSLPRDYPSFCREPLELLTQQLPAEKLCICIDCACLYLCVFLRVSLLFPPQ